jgi:hypothetical protein
MHLQGTKHFLQGEAPCHKAKKVNQSLPKGPTSSSSRCHANFPDLNPKCFGLDEFQAEGDLLLQHGRVEGRDHQALGDKYEQQLQYYLTKLI